MSTFAVTARKWRAVFGIFFQEGLAYRASGLIWVMTDLVTALTMPLVWAAASKTGPIAGFTTADFVLYYLSMLMLGSFVTSHMMWDVATEIKEGQFSTNLVRPISFYQYTFFRNLSWRIIRSCIFAPIFIGLLFLYRGHLENAQLHMAWPFWTSLLLGHLVSFTFIMSIAMLALVVTEIYSIFELYYIPMLFLSGQLFPVAVLPEWARNLAHLFPFYYTTGAPTEILIGRTTGGDITRVLLMQCAWVVINYLVARALWKVGLKYYTGVGM
jgi:ABC-2 type transport system permease protein